MDFKPDDIAWYKTGNFTSSRVRIRALDGSGATRRAWVDILDHAPGQTWDEGWNQGRGLPVAVRMLTPIGKDVQAVTAVSELMDALSVSADDLMLLWQIENQYGEHAEEYVEPSNGDTVFKGTVVEAWNRLAEEGTALGDTWQESADIVHDALEEHGFLVEHEAEDEIREYRVTLDTMRDQYVYTVEADSEDAATAKGMWLAREDKAVEPFTDMKAEVL